MFFASCERAVGIPCDFSSQKHWLEGRTCLLFLERFDNLKQMLGQSLGHPCLLSNRLLSTRNPYSVIW